MSLVVNFVSNQIKNINSTGKVAHFFACLPIINTIFLSLKLQQVQSYLSTHGTAECLNVVHAKYQMKAIARKKCLNDTDQKVWIECKKVCAQNEEVSKKASEFIEQIKTLDDTHKLCLSADTVMCVAIPILPLIPLALVWGDFIRTASQLNRLNVIILATMATCAFSILRIQNLNSKLSCTINEYVHKTCYIRNLPINLGI